MATQDSNRSILRRLEGWLRRAAPRQARLYCVGAPRTGTHSIAAMFDRSIRSRHEPGLRAVTQHVLAHHRGAISFDQLRAFVRERDARWRLDVDSSHANVFLIEAILAEFADARFLLTIRDCYGWTDAAMNHTLNARRRARADRQYLEFYFDAQRFDHSPHDAFLRAHGLWSVDCYLAAWRRHNERVLAAVPAERLLVVRTNEISQRLHEIAAFARLPAARLAGGSSRRGAARARHGMLARVDAAYLADRVAAHCGALMGRFFPSVRSLADASGDAGAGVAP